MADGGDMGGGGGDMGGGAGKGGGDGGEAGHDSFFGQQTMRTVHSYLCDP